MQPLFFCKPKTLGRWAVGPLMLSVALLGATASEVKAGDWSANIVSTYSATRDSEYGKVSEDNGGDVNSGFWATSIAIGSWGHDFYWNDYSSLVGTLLEPNGQGDGTSATPYGCFMKGKLILTYTPSANETVEQLPPTIQVKTITELDATAYYELNTLVSKHEISVATKPGGGGEFKIPITVSTNGDVKSWIADNNGINAVSLETEGGQWQNGQYVVEYPIDIEASNYASPGSQSFFENSGSSFSARLNERSVALSRGGRHEYSILRGKELHTYGDSIYSARNVSSTDGDFVCPLSLNASYSTGWSTWGTGYNISSQWQYQGFLNDATPSNFDPQSNNQGISGYTQFGTPTIRPQWFLSLPWLYSGSPTSPQTFTTTFTATDNADNATAKAYYHLTLHDPIETLDEGETTTHYTILKPYLSKGNVLGAGIVLGWSGVRDANSVTIEINDETSSETGIGLKATADVSAFTELLGLSAEANHTSIHKFTLAIKTEVPKDIAANQYRYLIGIHKFTRTHKRFDKYDASGKIRRMVSVDAYGNAINPPVDMYHELIEDTAEAPDASWSDPLPYTGLNPNTLPTTPIPPAEYDFPSGGSS